MENIKLKNKIAVVTGAGTGIGRAIAISLSQEGAKVFLIGRTQKTLLETDKEIKKYGGLSDIVVCDISKSDEVKNSFSKIIDTEKQIDILINNAASFGKPKNIEDISDIEWQDVVNTNINGTFYCTRAVLPIMKKKKDGYIINISSLATDFPYTLRAPYGTTKSALEYFTLVTAAGECIL